MKLKNGEEEITYQWLVNIPNMKKSGKSDNVYTMMAARTIWYVYTTISATITGSMQIYLTSFENLLADGCLNTT